MKYNVQVQVQFPNLLEYYDASVLAYMIRVGYNSLIEKGNLFFSLKEEGPVLPCYERRNFSGSSMRSTSFTILSLSSKVILPNSRS